MKRRRDRDRTVWAGVRASPVDAAVLAVLLTIATLGFHDSFAGGGRFVLAGTAGIALGLGLAALAARQRMNALLTVALAVLVYILAGTSFAAPHQGFAGVLPTADSLRTVVAGPVLSWKQLLTSAPPVGVASGLLVVPFLSAFVAALLAGTMAWRLRNSAWALLPVAGLMFLAAALGTHRAVFPAVRGVLFVAVAVTWLSFRQRRQESQGPALSSGGRASTAGPAVPKASSAVLVRRWAGTVLVLTIAGAATLAAAPLLGAADKRMVLRDVVTPPLDLHDYASPLTSFRDYVKNEKDTKLFSVAGLPAGGRVRLATLDSYDGVVFNVDGGGSSDFIPAGHTSSIGGTEAGATLLSFQIEDYTGVWLPSSGDVQQVLLAGDRAGELAQGLFFNKSTNTALVTASVQGGDSYTVNAAYRAVPTDAELAQTGFAAVPLPPLENVPEIVALKANEFVGEAATPIERVRKLEAALAKQGAFSHGLDGEARSLSGHGAHRIASLLSAKQMVGDDEQYATAMVLMARSLGMPARVVMGFYPDPKKPQGSPTTDITGNDVHAWAEVAFTGAGWVPFNPTPSEDNVPVPPDPQPKSKPQPQVLQPPPPPQVPAELPPDAAPDARDTEPEQRGFWAVLGPILAAIGIGLIPIAVLLAPLLLIVWLKRQRRKRRAVTGSPSDRMSGGWSEVMSLATDLGADVVRNGTRRENARSLSEAFPASGSSTLLLAERADQAIFAPGDPSDDEIQRFWAAVDASLDEMTGSVGFWRRQRARFSPRSLAAEGARYRAAWKTAAGRKWLRRAGTETAGSNDG